MTEMQKLELVMKYSDEILGIIDDQKNYARGDLQGRSEAIILSLLYDVQKLNKEKK